MATEQQIQTSLKFLGLIYNYSPLVYTIIGADHRIQFVSKQILNLLGYTQEEMIGFSCEKYLMKSIEQTESIVERTIQTQKIQEKVQKQYKKNKEIVYIKHVIIPIVESQILRNIMIISTDATETVLLQNKIEKRILDIITTLSKLIHVRSRFTGNHSYNVSLLANELSKRMQLTEEEQKEIYIAASLHDIGNIGIDDSIINKETKLSEEEYEKIKQHPVLGEDMLEHIEDFAEIRKIIRHHHENYDGSGYPDRLKKEEIPLGSRIIAVVDTFEAMNARRPYRDPLPYEVIVSELKNMRGKRLDPMIVEIFIDYLHEANFKETIDEAHKLIDNKFFERNICEKCGNFYIAIEHEKQGERVCFSCKKCI